MKKPRSVRDGLTLLNKDSDEMSMIELVTLYVALVYTEGDSKRAKSVLSEITHREEETLRYIVDLSNEISSLRCDSEAADEDIPF